MMQSRREFLRVAGAAGFGTQLCWLLAGCGDARSIVGRGGKKPNIIFILADDLGYGDLGCYGQQHIKTPSLDKMAAEGMRFTRHYAGCAVCAPSRCVLMTGLHTGHAYIRGNSKDNLRPSDVTIAELLKQAGYATGHVGKWGLGHEGSTGIPTRKGFDYFFGYLDQHHAHNYYPDFLVRNEQRIPLKNIVPHLGRWGQGVASEKVEYSHDLFTLEALDFIGAGRDRPFFLYLAYTIPHANNEAGDKGMEVPSLGFYEGQDWPAPQKAHAAMITRMDADIGRIFKRLKELGIDNDTLVLFSSDNGPHAEGGANPIFFNSSGGLRGCKRDLYEGGIRVPMIARWPGHIQAGSVSDYISAFWDWLPTFCEMAYVYPPDGIDGISLVPTLLGRAQRQRKHEYLYWEFHEQGGRQAVRVGDYKLVWFIKDNRLELYNLKDDPAETSNIIGQYPQAAAGLKEYMRIARTPSELWPMESI